MIKIKNTLTKKEVVLEKESTLKALLILFHFDISEGIDIRKLEEGLIDSDSLNLLCEAGIAKQGSLSDKGYVGDPDSTRYFINPIIAYFLHQELHEGSEFITRELGVEGTIDPLTFYNESYLQFWSLEDLDLPEISRSRIDEYRGEVEVNTQRIYEYLDSSKRFSLERE